MKLHLSAAMLSAMALTLGGCATAVPPVEVTRFHSAAPTGWAAGTHYVVDTVPLGDAAAPDGVGVGASGPSLEWDSYRAAVERQLQLQGFVPAENGARAPLKVRIGFDRADRNAGVGKRSPVSVGVGGSTGSYGSGVGLGIGINLGGGGSKWMLDLQLAVRIDDAATGQALWEGRALTAVSAKAPAAQPSLAAAKLADALFKGFPGESGRTITVK
ncbi:DUF4136 domain-containing protein [Sphingopyxis macrogoltabida]|uniref:DUF4136 domain-containing protein n=1 Tax=Sphingopyxis macrogoltabida TaxID=33050 RepID=A0AAC9AZ07_SPHMC|nr:DUF4136 domain-containing protein [Sphingopyxis macrogoltabida]ALJ15951.1 hypothetical protein LH19_23995 [Sphingopyxis macrogoltabida]AMU92191.1 hypothetical protein ATM17_24555 [Sphingopyxis macrogoltabida]